MINKFFSNAASGASHFLPSLTIRLLGVVWLILSPVIFFLFLYMEAFDILVYPLFKSSKKGYYILAVLIPIVIPFIIIMLIYSQFIQKDLSKKDAERIGLHNAFYVGGMTAFQFPIYYTITGIFDL